MKVRIRKHFAKEEYEVEVNMLHRPPDAYPFYAWLFEKRFFNFNAAQSYAERLAKGLDDFDIVKEYNSEVKNDG